MTTATKPRQACVQFADPEAPSGAELSSATFLRECRQSALARFRHKDDARIGCRTITHPVPPKPRCTESTGMIVAHISPALCLAWESAAPGTQREKRAHVDAQIHLALTDLADQDMHGYLAVTEAQCEVYDPDLTQLVSESLGRTSFSNLGRDADPHWEGTLVEKVKPPYLVLAVSIGFDGPSPRHNSVNPALE
ncbi:MAG: hypothetical protein AABY18_07800 [Candidatus Thermoplasmatota archaeon]